MAIGDKKKTVKKAGKTPILIAIGLALGLVPLIGGLRIFLSQPGGSPGGPGKAEADSFLDKLRKGQTDQAWQSAAGDFKSYMGKDTLRALVKKNPALKEPASPVAVDSQGREGRDIHEYTTQKSGKKIAIGVTMENGQPKVDSLQIR